MKSLARLSLLLVLTLTACDSTGPEPISGRYQGTVSAQLLDGSRAQVDHVLTVREDSRGALTGEMTITMDGAAMTYVVAGAHTGARVVVGLLGGEREVAFQGYAEPDARRINLVAQWDAEIDEYGLTLTYSPETESPQTVR